MKGICPPAVLRDTAGAKWRMGRDRHPPCGVVLANYQSKDPIHRTHVSSTNRALQHSERESKFGQSRFEGKRQGRITF